MSEPAATETTEQVRAATGRRLLAASTLMAAGTLVSRLFGLGRNMMAGYVLGTDTAQADMFAVALSIPTMLYFVFAGGTLNTVLVPQIVRAIKNDGDHGEAYVNRIITAFGAATFLFTVAVTLAARPITWLLTDSKWHTEANAAKFDNMATLTQLMMIQVFFWGVFFMCGQVLNAIEKFGPMMWAPAMNNIVQVLLFVCYASVYGTHRDHSVPFTSDQTFLLAAGTTVAVLSQGLILVWFLHRTGFRFRPRWDLRGTGLGRTVTMAKWVLWTVIITQVANAVVQRIATSATADESGAGLVVYQNGFLLWMMPHGLVTVSLVTALIPHISRLADSGDMQGVRHETMRAIRLTTSVMVPVAVAMAILALPIATLLWGYGSGAAGVPAIAWTLVAYCVGVPLFTIVYVLVRMLYALEDSKAVFYLSAAFDVCNIVLAILFVYPFHRPDWVAPGLALSFALSHVPVLPFYYRALARHVDGVSMADTLRHGLRVTLATLPAGVAAWAICSLVMGATSARWALALAFLASAAVGAALFYLAAKALKITEVTDVVGMLNSRLLRRRSASALADRSAQVAAEPERESPAALDTTVAAAALDEPARDEATRDDRDPDADSTDPASDPAHDATGPAGRGAHPADRPTGPADQAPDPADRTRDRAEGPTRTAGDPDATHVRTPASTPPTTPAATPVSTPAATSAAAVPAGPVVTAPATDFYDQEADRPTGPEQGEVLGRRYRLDEHLVTRSGIQTWRAFDTVLSRPALVHILPPHDERTPELMAAARRAAIATDSRFLRVLDAVLSQDDRLGSWVVSEFVPGSSLEVLLAEGPLTAVEAGWIVREVADALVAMHAQGLHHTRIDPDTVIVSRHGGVKIVGFLTEAVLHPRPGDDELTEADREALDVEALGKLLYAGLVAAWPGGPAYGLPGVATRDGRWLTPREVRPGVSPALDNVCDQILSRPPRDGGAPLRSAHEVFNALTRVLGSVDGSRDLERRLRRPVLPGHPTTPGTMDSALTRGSSASAASATSLVSASAVTPPSADSATEQTVVVTTETRGFATPTEVDGPPTLVGPRQPEPGTRHARGGHREPLDEDLTDDAGVDPLLGAHASQQRHRRDRTLPLLLLLVGALAVSLIIGLAGWRARSQGQVPTTRTTQGAATLPAPAPVPITGVRDFDPEGSRSETPGELTLAIDGNPATAWHTERYPSSQPATLAGVAKSGIGIILDLGAVTDVRAVKLTMIGEPTTMEIRVPTDAGATTAPLETASAWQKVADLPAAGTAAEATLATPARARWVLVWITRLPQVQGGYQAAVAEAVVLA